LIGHSAGTIYVQRMLEALDARLPVGSAAQLDIILLASAISLARMNAGLSVLRKRARGLRVFALYDETESSYFEVWPIYDKSLLYIVSSLCEEDSNVVFLLWRLNGKGANLSCRRTRGAWRMLSEHPGGEGD